jgi:hypothetical protein
MSNIRRHMLLAAAVEQAGGGGPQFVGASGELRNTVNQPLQLSLSATIPGLQNDDYIVIAIAADSITGDGLTFDTGSSFAQPIKPPNLRTQTGLSPGQTLALLRYDSSLDQIRVGFESSPYVMVMAAFRNVEDFSDTSRLVNNGSTSFSSFPASSLSGTTAGSIVVVAGMLDDDGALVSPSPNYTIAAQGTALGVGNTSSNNSTVMIAYRENVPGGTESPGLFDLNGANDGLVVYTLELLAAP